MNSSRPRPPSPRQHSSGRTGLVAAVAAASSLLLGPSAQAAGLLVPAGGQRSLSIASQQVDVSINNGIAVTTVTQVFHNDGPRPLEARYTFPIPARASVSNFSMWINGKEMPGEVVEKKEGQRIYDTIVRPEVQPRQFKDPACWKKPATTPSR